MTDILVRDVPEETKTLLKQIALSQKRSMNDVAKEALQQKANEVRESREAMWERIDAIRERIGPLKGDSLDDIREFRERAW